MGNMCEHKNTHNSCFFNFGFVDFPCSVCFFDPNPCVIVVIHKLNRYKHLVSFLFELHANGENIVVILFWFNISLLIFLRMCVSM